MITLPELCLLVLAAYRATRLIVADDIAAPIRGVIHAWHERRIDSGVRQAAVTLFNCPFCMGVWVSAGLLALWLWLFGHGWPNPVEYVIILLAVSGGQALLNRWDDTRPEGVA